jgi:hypothetical protein
LQGLQHALRELAAASPVVMAAASLNGAAARIAKRSTRASRS